MSGFVLCMALSGSGVGSAGRRGNVGTTTARWQDKGPRCAALCGCGFSMCYGAFTRCAPDRRSLREWHFVKVFRDFARCAGRQS